jgi:hypothetical protein
MIMGEIVLDKLTQKVSNMLDDIGEVNILIRRLTPTQETLSRINERVDAIVGVLKQLEKGVQLDENKLRQLEEQGGLLKEGLEAGVREGIVAVQSTVEETLQHFIQTSERLQVGMASLFSKGVESEDAVKNLTRLDTRMADQINELSFLEKKWWDKNEWFEQGLQVKLSEIQVKLSEIKVVGIIVIVLLLMVLSLRLFR